MSSSSPSSAVPVRGRCAGRGRAARGAEASCIGVVSRRARIRDTRHPRRPAAGPADRCRGPAHLRHQHVRPGRRRGPAPRLRVQPDRQSDPDGARGVSRGTRGWPPCARLRQRDGRRGHAAAHHPAARRPHRDPRRRVRRHVPPGQQGGAAVGRLVERRADDRPGNCASRDATGDKGRVGRDTDQPDAGHRRHHGAGRPDTRPARCSSSTTPSPRPTCSNRSRWARTPSCTRRRSTAADIPTSWAARS